ncbi:MAG: hypothetical protein ACP5QR_04900 [Rhizomicrobium sp.]
MTTTNTYAWSLQGPPLVCASLDGLTDVVSAVHWQVVATSTTAKPGVTPMQYYTARRYGGPLSLGAPNPASFTPFASVTLATLMGWVQTQMEANEAGSVKALTDAMDAEIAAAIAADANPATPKPMALVAA